MFDGKEFAAEIIEAVKVHVGKALAPIEQRLAMLEARPPPEKGDKGDPGESGAAGEPGAPGEPGAEGPAGRDGRDGQPGRDGEPGPRGFRGEDGVNGRDGVDGLGFDDLAVEYDGARSFVMRFAQGERVKEFPFAIPAMIYRGAWSSQECYGQGDTVTCNGSLWFCSAATGAPPDEGVEGWIRAVRRGRDGKNGKDGEKGDVGPVGRAGRDLTQMAMDGSKW